jgi:hypothetical protein
MLIHSDGAVRLRVATIPSAIAVLKENDIAITQGPVSFGDSGQVSVFIRDPDRNVVELRGRNQGPVEGVTRYVPSTYSTRNRTPVEGRLWGRKSCF